MSEKKRAGAFDLRNVIAALLGLYGLILLGCYFFLDPGINPDTGQAKNAAITYGQALLCWPWPLPLCCGHA